MRAVIAGHMHHKLLHPRGAERKRFIQRGGTTFINCAVVPRVERGKNGEELSYFVRMRWLDGECTSIEEVWVDTHGGEHSAVPVQVETIADGLPTIDEADEP